MIAEQRASVTAAEELTPIAVEVNKIRTLFLAQLSRLPSPFDELAKKHYLGRLVRAGDRHMLGEYAPFLLADVLQIRGASVAEVIIPWLVLYEQVLTIDDVIDVRGASLAQEVLLSQVLFSEFVSLWREKFYANPPLWDAFCKYHREGALAALKEVERAGEQTSATASTGFGLNSEFHLSNGRKAALVKFCATALTLENKGRLLTKEEEQGIDKLCAGIQLLDDLTDSVEDYLEGRLAFPLREGLLWLHKLDGRGTIRQGQLGEDEITFVLLASGAAVKVAKLSCSYISSGMSELRMTNESATGKFLISLAESSAHSAEGISNMLSSNSHRLRLMSLALVEGGDSFKKLITTPEYISIWDEMKTHFGRIAVASN